MQLKKRARRAFKLFLKDFGLYLKDGKVVWSR